MKIFAPAKINLMLHVTGRRDDGYHLLQSLMVLTGLGDTLEITPADAFTLAVTGPYAAHVPLGGDNLVARAAVAMGQAAGRVPAVAVTLDKQVPAGAGLGGGSADAAALMRALNDMWGRPFDFDALCRIGLALGAELPFCLANAARKVGGIGDTLEPVTVPILHGVVIWPAVRLGTVDVFKAYAQSAPIYSDAVAVPDAVTFDWLRAQRNDLLSAAISLAPVIGDALGALADEDGCVYSRMTGSGSSVFGIFESDIFAKETAAKLAAAYPGWYVKSF